MSEVDPAAPPAEPAESREDGTPVAGSGARTQWLGIVVVLFGITLMVVGIVSVYLYVQNLPTPAAAPSAALPPALPPPSPPPQATELPSAVPSEQPPAPASPALAPFAEDATSPVPVERDRPLWGPRNAPVTLTLFGDFECPYTVAFLRVVFAEKARRGDGLRLAFRHAPLGQHAVGERAARVLAGVHASLGDGTFWGIVQEIARRGEPLSAGVLDGILATLNVEPSESDDTGRRVVEEDAVLAATLFVRSTPVAFVNGVRLDGFRSQRTLAEAIARERKLAGLVLASGVTPAALYTARTRKNLINVGEDPPERTCVPPGASPVRGAKDALVTIVEFTEHACEYCRQGDARIARVLSERPRELRSVWRTFPLRQHPRARYAASFALEARRSGGDDAFWTLTKALFDEQGELDDDAAFERAAERAKLEVGPLRAAAEQSAHDAVVDEDVRLAESLGVSAVPTYFINGRRISGVLALTDLRRVIAEELALARRVRKNGAGSVAELACGARAAETRSLQSTF